MAAKKAAKKKTAKRKTAARRELIDTGTNKLFVRRNARGTSFEEVVDVGKSLAADRRQKAKRWRSLAREIRETGAALETNLKTRAPASLPSEHGRLRRRPTANIGQLTRYGSF